MNQCEKCKGKHDCSYGSGRFCSSKCARSFSTKNSRSDINKKVSQKLKGKVFRVYKDKFTKESKSNKKEKEIYCKHCGSQSKKIICVDCKPFIQNIILFKKLNLYVEHKKLSEINKDCLSLLNYEYFDQGHSKLVIMKKYKLQSNTIYDFFKKNNVTLRSLSEAVTNGIINGNVLIPTNFSYHKGYHLTWNNKKVYYRSSYELNYCKQLDEIKIDYDMESLRIKYFDTQVNKKRIAVPDFYLIDENMIVEIKSTYTLNIQNMKDKFKAYESLGYKTKLIVENAEFELFC
jgi:hypothetical protein